MNNRERFKAVANFETPDYVPIFGFPGAPGMSGGCMKKTHDRLVATGMPSHVPGRSENWSCKDVESWRRYWGTTGPIGIDFGLAGGAKGFESTWKVEGEHVIIEEESGAITRELLDNSITYIMPEFIRYAVRDRESWEFYKERTRPTEFMSREKMEENCRRYDDRDMPLCIGAGSTYEPELIHDMIQTSLAGAREHVFPLIERLKPEIVALGEDLCYNHGMLLSPKHFDEYCGQYYREVCDCAHANGASVVAIDTDGNAMEFTGVAASCGVNAIYPYEVKAGNDLFVLREKHPRFVFIGWLEKEAINEGNEDTIEPEIMSKVPPLLEKGGYFPNGDHGIQPLATFPSLRRFMTLLHEVTGNPEGEFLRV